MSSSKYGSSSGGGDEPFKNNTPGSMSKKLKEPKKKRGEEKKKEEEQSQRRRVQNRNAQRAYRERREQRIRELEAELEQTEMLNQNLTEAYQSLKAEVDRLIAERSNEQYDWTDVGQSDAMMGPSFVAMDPATFGLDLGSGGAGQNVWIPEEWETEDNTRGHER